MVSRNGIYYDLTKSRYKFKVNNLTFVFSSDLHMMKFEDRLLENRNEINMKLTARYRYNINFDLLADFVLYQKIETRGFFVLNEKGLKICKENLILNGGQVTLKSLQEKLNVLTQR